MTFKRTTKFPIHTLAILAVQHGRELGVDISTNAEVLGEIVQRPAMGAVVSRLATGELCEEHDFFILEALEDDLAKHISMELISTEVVPYLVGETDDETFWRTREVSTYSERGMQALLLQKSLQRFFETWRQLDHQVKAERLVSGLRF